MVCLPVLTTDARNLRGVTPYDLGWGNPYELTAADLVPAALYPGLVLPVRNADVGTVFAELIRRLRASGWAGPDDTAVRDEWTYAPRLKRWAQAAGYQWGSAPYGYVSDHAWATGLDLDAAANPMLDRRPAEVWRHTDMPPNTARIAADLLLDWGGLWTVPFDPMHFGVACTPAELAAVARSLRYTEFPPARYQLEDDDMVIIEAGTGAVVVVGDQRYTLTSAERAALLAQGVRKVSLQGDTLGSLGARVLAGTPNA